MSKLIDWFADRPQWVFITCWTAFIALLMALVILIGVWTS